VLRGREAWLPKTGQRLGRWRVLAGGFQSRARRERAAPPRILSILESSAARSPSPGPAARSVGCCCLRWKGAPALDHLRRYTARKPQKDHRGQGETDDTLHESISNACGERPSTVERRPRRSRSIFVLTDQFAAVCSLLVEMDDARFSGSAIARAMEDERRLLCDA
jgi:hypothetical protein